MNDDAGRPDLRIVRGDADADELAALVTVLSALGTRTVPPDDAPPPAWTDRAAALRRPLPHGRGAWHGSGFPST